MIIKILKYSFEAIMLIASALPVLASKRFHYLTKSISIFCLACTFVILFLSICDDINSYRQITEQSNKFESEIAVLKKKTELVDPFKQPLRTGTATVEVVISSNDELDNRYIDRGGYIAFGKGKDALIQMSSIECFGKQIGNSQVRYRGVFNLDATDKSIGNPISHLVEAEYAQIGFFPLPPKSKVINGTAICTFNSSVRIELTVPPQQMQSNFIIIPEVKSSFKDYYKSN